MQASESLPEASDAALSGRHLLSTTGSTHSHLSTLTDGPQRRLRAPGPPRIRIHPPSPDAKVHAHEPYEYPLAGARWVHTGPRVRRAWWPAVLVPHEGQTAGTRAAVASVQWVVLAYCLISVLVFSARLAGWISPGNIAPAIGAFGSNVPPIRLRSRSLPPRITSVYPPPLALNTLSMLPTDLLDGRPVTSEHDPGARTLTGCLWTTDAEIDLFPAWTSRWPGSISLLVTTFKPPSNTTAFASLVRHLVSLASSTNSTLPRRIDVHILSLDPQTQDTPNAFLNLARLLALLQDPTPPPQASRHVLFPADLATLPPPGAYTAFLTHASSHRSSTPALLANAAALPLPAAIAPAPGLAPLLLPAHGARANMEVSDDAGWCPERLLPPVPRGADWALCVRALWLRAAGRIGRAAVPPGTAWPYDGPASSARSFVEERVNGRLAEKWGEEACVLAAKRLVALRDAEEGEEKGEGVMVDNEEARWLREACKDTLTGWGKGIL